MPFLPLGAAILPLLDLEVIPINMYENFMIKRRISPFIFQTCPNTSPSPKSPYRQVGAPALCQGPLGCRARNSQSGEFVGPGSPAWTELQGVTVAFLPSLSP